MGRSEESTSSCFATIVQRFVCTGNLPTHPYPPPPPPPSPYGNEPKTHKITKTVGYNTPPATTTTTNPHQKSHGQKNNNKRSPLCYNSSVKDLKIYAPAQHQVPADQAEGEANGTVPGIVARLMGLERLPQHWVHSSQQHNAMATTTTELRSKSLNALYLWPDFNQTTHGLQQQQRPRFQHRRTKSSYVSFHECGVPAPASTLQTTSKQSNSIDDDPYAAAAAAAESNGSGNSNKSYTKVLKGSKIETDPDDSVLLPNSITEKKKVEKNTTTNIHKGGRKDEIKNISSNRSKDERKTMFGDNGPKINTNRKSDGGIQLHVSPRKESGHEHGNGRIHGASNTASKKKPQVLEKTSKRSDNNVLYNKDLPPDDFGSNTDGGGGGTTSSGRKNNQLKGCCYKDGGNQHSSSNQIMHKHAHVSLRDHLQCSSKFDSPSKGKKEPTAQITTNSRRSSGRRRIPPQLGIKLSYEEKPQAITILQQHPDNYHGIVSSGEEEKGGDSSSVTKRERRRRGEYGHVEEVNIMEQVSMLAEEYIRDVIWVEKNVVKIDQLVQGLSLRFSEEVLDVLLCQFVDELCLV